MIRRLPMGKGSEKIGLWLIGACGGIGCTVAFGLAALRKGLTGPTGLVTELPEMGPLSLVDPSRIELGGHEIRKQTLLDAVQEMHIAAGLFDESMIAACAPTLRSMQKNIRPGTLRGANNTIRQMADDPAEDGPSGSAVLKRICDDLEEFRQANKLDHVVVVHTASAEPPINGHNAHKNYKDLKKALQAKKTEILPASSLYALAAVEAGCSYFNFTPSTGIALPAILERAEEKGTLYMGRDGKTGETLLKSVLAPMFANRHLNVMSWIGHNILGNRDGEVLKDPVNKAEKLKSKDQLLRRIVGYPVDSQVSIEFVRSLSDWKVAWDFIHFQGFLNTKMSLQFTWQGSDSILAAPLVIDLARLATHEWRNGRSGCMKHLACFFKDPMDVAEQSFLAQCDLLRNHLANSGAAVELKKR